MINHKEKNWSHKLNKKVLDKNKVIFGETKTKITGLPGI